MSGSERPRVIEGPAGNGRAVRAVGAALVLCSSITVIGYGSLLLADNQVLRSFGAMAILGGIATLAAAVTMLPAALLVQRRASGPVASG